MLVFLPLHFSPLLPHLSLFLACFWMHSEGEVDLRLVCTGFGSRGVGRCKICEWIRGRGLTPPPKSNLLVFGQGKIFAKLEWRAICLSLNFVSGFPQFGWNSSRSAREKCKMQARPATVIFCAGGVKVDTTRYH